MVGALDQGVGLLGAFEFYHGVFGALSVAGVEFEADRDFGGWRERDWREWKGEGCKYQLDCCSGWCGYLLMGMTLRVFLDTVRCG